MCSNPFKKPKVETVEVEKVADPAPQVITPTDTGAAEDRVAEEGQKQRKKKGFAATRVADDRAVLTDTAQTGARQTLG